VAGTQTSGGFVNKLENQWTSGRRIVQVTILTDDDMSLSDLNLMKALASRVSESLEGDPQEVEPLEEMAHEGEEE
jgi:hypothetical protein